MLVVKPDVNNDNNELKTLNAFIDDASAGFIRFRHRGFILVIEELLPIPEHPEQMDSETYALLDTVIRALGSYGLNHSCFYLECSNPMLYPTLGRLRFSMKDGMMKSTLAQVLKSCGHH